MKKIGIVGSGPAGIEAAIQLSKHHFKVFLFEKENHIAENVSNKAFLFPNFLKASDLVAQMKERLNDDVELHLETKIINMEQVGQEWHLTDQKEQQYVVDAVLLATGYTVFDAKRKEELGYGIYKGVITSLDLEEMLKKEMIVNFMNEQPKKVVFLQCVGSRDEKTGNNYCSKVCCVTAVKQAVEVRKLLPDAEIFVFYMDLRMWGQSFEEMYRKAQEEYHIRFVRGRISEAANTFDGKVQIKSEDTLVGMPLKMTTDLLVLMVGMEPSAETKYLTSLCNIAGDYGFAATKDPFFNDNMTTRPGLFVAGACKRPMSIRDSITDARSVVETVIEYLS